MALLVLTEPMVLTVQPVLKEYKALLVKKVLLEMMAQLVLSE